MEHLCISDACPVLLDSKCVFYKGDSLVYIGTVDGQNLTTVLNNINNAIASLVISGSGHIIVNPLNVDMPQRQRLKFERLVVTDDNLNNRTVVTRPSDTFVGTTPPSNPVQGDVWTDSRTMKEYVFYDNYWIHKPGIAEDGSGTLPINFPDTPNVGDIFTSAGHKWKYKGSSIWEIEPEDECCEYIPNGVTTATVGGIPQNTDLGTSPISIQDLLDDILYPYIQPVFNFFTVAGQPTTVEVGTTLSGTRTFNWSINPNSGTVPTINIFDITSGVNILTGTANDGTENTGILTIILNTNGATQSWRGVGNNTNPTGTFNSSPFTVTARFYRFFGPSASTPTNSAQVRSLPVSEFQTANVDTFILNTGTTHKKFVVALPPGRTISNVIDLDAFNTEITSEYVFLGTITVDDAGFSPRTYNLYEMNLGAPYSSNHRHQITTA